MDTSDNNNPFDAEIDGMLAEVNSLTERIDSDQSFSVADATKEDFCTTIPYAYLYSLRKDRFNHDVKRDEMADAAKLVGIRNFKKRYENYVNDIRFQSAKPVGAVTDFQDQPLELSTGKWQASESGVWCEGEYQDLYACSHPIMPVERLINIDSGMEKMRIAFRAGYRWREYIADKSTLASAQAIIALSDYGISVTSETSKNLVKYFQDLEHLNYSIIPEKHSVGRLGWIHGYGFSPYVDNIVFDGEVNFKGIFESVSSHGKEQGWLDTIAEIRSGSLTARVVLASAFASVLVGPCGCLPFFVHLWGNESGTGKTVALMVAASVWACPSIGKYIQTFNSTVVSRERTSAFLNSLPMMIDELQLSKDIKGIQRFDVYQLAEGVGRGRGLKVGGTEKMSTWSNCVITTGEAPITLTGAGSGAVNRVVDIECRTSEPVVTDGHGMVKAINRNYGWAGKRFISHLDDEGLELARAKYSEYFQQLTQGDTTEKQAMAAALIVTADHLATDWIFQDDRNVTVSEIGRFLATKAQVSANVRGYQYMCEWVSQNSARFMDDQTGDRYGVIENNIAYIISNTFNHAAEAAGFSATALLSYLDNLDLIETKSGRKTIIKRIGSIPTRCVVLKLPEDIPFDV